MTRQFSSKFIPSYLRSQWTAFFHDALMIALAWIGAFWLRFNLEEIPQQFFVQGSLALFVIFPVQILSFQLFGLYKGIWRFASLPDIFRIIKAVATGVLASMLILFVFTRAEGIPRSVPIIYSILLVMFLSSPRLLYRWLKDHHVYIPSGKKVLIVGAGNAGEMLARDILRNQKESYYPVAFVDDNPTRLGREIHGLKIVGKTMDIPGLVDTLGIEIIMLAIPSARPKDMQRIVEICETTGIPFRSVPLMKDLVSGQVNVNELREVSIEDLLGRDPVTLNWEGITKTLSNKVILITGAGGSIGSELCRQISRINPKKLILLDNSEFNLYSIEHELNKSCPDLNISHYLGDVTDKSYIEYILEQNRPQIVFHAAAYKHVPMLENQVRQAMRNNIVGTRNTADAASKHGVEIFVLVSTDKAVHPANVMGATKRAAEIYCQNLNAHSDTHFVTVRFGNVLGSAGSVIPLFRQQIKSGGPVTVTDPRMERYFMTIPEACQLIMQTTVLGTGGEIFVLDMGEPVKIGYLAEQMIRLSGKTPGEDIQIEFIGLRPGEKLYEELFHEKEQLEGTGHKKVFLARHRKVDWTNLITIMDQIKTACEQLQEDRLVYLLDQLVPEHAEQVSRQHDQKQQPNQAKNVVQLK